MIRTRTLATLTALSVLAGSLAGCSSPDYKSLTCKQWLALGVDDQLSAAQDFFDSAGLDPKHGESDYAEFGDTVSGVCGPTSLDATKIIDLQGQVVDVFLSVHPDDAP